MQCNNVISLEPQLNALKIEFVHLQNDSFGICFFRTLSLVFVEYSPMTDSYLQLFECMNTTLP